MDIRTLNPNGHQGTCHLRGSGIPYNTWVPMSVQDLCVTEASSFLKQCVTFRKKKMRLLNFLHDY